MADPSATPETTLRLTRTFAASRKEVFRAWTDPEELRKWFAPSDDYSTPLVEVDLRIGGRYRIQMKAPDGATYTVVGTFRQVIVPEKLVYTWTWEGGESSKAEGLDSERGTLVTVEFHQRGDATDVTLTHELFLDEEQRDKHSQGWTGCLNRLANIV